MTELKGWKRKAVLLFKSEKRLGAGQIVSSYNLKTYSDMKKALISESDIDLTNVIDKVRIKDLSGHLNKVKKEFISQYELCYYHATLIILLRRDYKPEIIFKEFEKLWLEESEFLLNNLSLRWIISACDTFVDFDYNSVRASLLMNAITMVNTLKVYETQKFLFYPQQLDMNNIVKENMNKLYNQDLKLYDGLTFFRIGGDDTLKNMRQRYEKLAHKNEISYKILINVFDRLQDDKTAFKTMKDLHIDDKSKWWI